MATFSGGLSSYCSASQFLERYDVRTIGDLLSDSGTRLTAGQVASSTILANLLKQSSGEVEAAAMVEGRYTAADLAALDGNAQQVLIGLVADLTLYKIYNRRPDRVSAIPQSALDAKNTLEALRQGQRIFPFEETMEAGRKVEFPETPEGVFSQRAADYFGDTATFSEE